MQVAPPEEQVSADVFVVAASHLHRITRDPVNHDEIVRGKYQNFLREETLMRMQQDFTRSFLHTQKQNLIIRGITSRSLQQTRLNITPSTNFFLSLYYILIIKPKGLSQHGEPLLLARLGRIHCVGLT